MRVFRRGFREKFVGSESAGDYFNIKNLGVLRWVVVVVLVIDFAVDL